MLIRIVYPLLLLSTLTAYAQPDLLDAYVEEGLRNNLALQQQTLDLSRSRQALAESRARYLPSIDFAGRYSRAGGGREIEFPVGDLLNPVYGTLNDLLAAQGQPGPFPTLENELIPFLRTREQETKIRLVQPVFQPAIRQGVRIQSSLADAQEAAVDAYKRQLTADIKTAYFTYLKTESVIEIYDDTHTLTAENVRVNERLFRNGKVTQDAVFRAEADEQEILQTLAEAHKQRDQAAAYFNFLLNRPLDTPIERLDPAPLLPQTDDARVLPVVQVENPSPLRSDLERQALDHRDELRQLDHALQAAEANRRLEQSAWFPGVSFVLDYGIQGETYRFDDDSDFWMASVVVNWNLFDGLRKRHRTQQATLERRKLEAQRSQLEQHIQLQVREAFDNVRVARTSIETARERVRAAQQSFRLVNRKYTEGMVNQVAFLDARTTFTRARLNLTLTEYDLLIRYAELERAIGA